MHNLLIIDDEDNIIGLLQEYLSQLGYRVMSAKDGKEGIELFNSDANFDLVITDIMMDGQMRSDPIAIELPCKTSPVMCAKAKL